MPRSHTVLRAIDANLNRSREAARVIEDWARFGLDDQQAANQLKLIRSALAQIEVAIGTPALLAARDTQNDVGTSVTSPTEAARPTAASVLTANFRRLGESLRSLEEFCKLAAPQAAAAIEQARYASYVLEQRLTLPPVKRVLASSSVMLVATKELCAKGYSEVLTAAWRAGIRCFQLREKAGSDRERFDTLKAGVAALRALSDVAIIINDRADFCLSLGADGVHLGQGDLPLAAARELLGESKVIGASARTPQELAAAALADYVGAGSMFATSTKSDTLLRGPAWGGEATRATTLPVFCIGGITPANAGQLAAVGVQRIAVSSAICAAADPEHAATALLALYPARPISNEGAA